MNDYMTGVIDCCFDLSVTDIELVDFIKKTTGLTDSGISNNAYIQQRIKEKRARD
jgi:hypothetical protein